MLTTLIIWLYILTSAYIYGRSFSALLGKIFKQEHSRAPASVPITMIIGFVVINFLAALFSLFINLGWLSQMIFFLLGVSLFLIFRKKQTFFPRFEFSRLSIPVLCLGLLLFLLVLELTTHPASNPDTGIYHAQAIRWMETFPAVPGLGNLHSRFAYNSNWLVLNALFSFRFMNLQSFHVLPGAFVLVTMLFFLEGMYKFTKGERTAGNIIRSLSIPLFFFIMGSEVSSPGTDLPSTIMICITVILLVESTNKQHSEDRHEREFVEILILLLCFYSITVKLSSAPLLLLGILVLVTMFRKNRSTVHKALIIAIVFMIPWLARNLITSGHWIYPLPSISILSPNWDWKIPLESVINEKDVIIAWARIPRADTGYVLSLSMVGWMQEWFENLTRNQSILVVAAFASPLIMGINFLFFMKKQEPRSWYLVTYCVIYVSLLFWLLTAPDIRFGYGILLMSILLAFCPFLSWASDQSGLRKAASVSLLLVLTLYLGSVLYRSFDSQSLSVRYLLPADYGSLATQPCSISGYTLFCAQYYDACWYEPFPCIPPSSLKLEVELRGDSLRDGFHVITHP